VDDQGYSEVGVAIQERKKIRFSMEKKNCGMSLAIYHNILGTLGNIQKNLSYVVHKS
jgi:hypothetical protein